MLSKDGRNAKARVQRRRPPRNTREGPALERGSPRNNNNKKKMMMMMTTRRRNGSRPSLPNGGGRRALAAAFPPPQGGFSGRPSGQGNLPQGLLSRALTHADKTPGPSSRAGARPQKAGHVRRRGLISLGAASNAGARRTPFPARRAVRACPILKSKGRKTRDALAPPCPFHVPPPPQRKTAASKAHPIFLRAATILCTRKSTGFMAVSRRRRSPSHGS